MSMPPVCIQRSLPDVNYLPHDIQRIALMRLKKWPVGAILNVAFRSGSPGERSSVQACCEELMQYVNLEFRFGKVSGPLAEVRVTFDPNGGAWSYIGTDLRGIPRDQPTMNLGFGQDGTYLHEFCHSLGAIHEHQNPLGGIKWNKEQVYRDLSGPPNNWDRQTIDRNMFEAYSVDQLNGTEFDPRSIMLYAIPKRWTMDGFSSQPNGVLSEVDKAWLRAQYPGRGTPEPTVPAILIPVFDLTPTGDTIARPGERDLFRFNLTRPGRVRVEETRGETTIVMRLFGPNSTTALVGEANNVGMSVRFRPKLDLDLKAGEYLVQISHASPQGVGAYSLRVLQAAEGEVFSKEEAETGEILISGVGPLSAGRYDLQRRV